MRRQIGTGGGQGRLRTDRRGIALLVALLIMIFLSLAGTTFLMFSLTESRISTNQAEAAVALEMAEAGVDQVIFWLGNPRVYVDQVGANPGYSFHRYLRTDKSGNGSETWYSEGNGQTSYMTSTVAGQRFFDKRAWDAQRDIPYLVGRLVSGALGTPPRQFNGTYTAGLTPGAGGSQPDLILDGSIWSAHQTTLDSVFSDVRAATGGRVRRIVLYGSVSGNSASTVRVTGESRSGVSRTVEMELVPIGAPGLAQSIGSGGTAGWNGNFRIHWGGVKSVGNVTLANPGKTAYQKAALPGAMDGSDPDVGGGNVGYYEGAPGAYDTWDHLFTMKTAGTIDGFATQADLKDAYGQSATIWGDNLVPMDSNVTIDTIATWDYASLKKLAQEKNWYYESGTGANAGKIKGPKTGGIWTDFKPALANQTGFVFIDTTNGSAPAADGSNLANFTVSGSWYTGVSAYIGGNLDFSGLGPGTSTTVQTPPWDATCSPPCTSPTDSEDPALRQSRTLDVHIKGAFYGAGTVAGGGNVKAYGAFVALRGYGAGGDPEVWYDWGLRNGILSVPPVQRASNTWHEVKVN